MRFKPDNHNKRQGAGVMGCKRWENICAYTYINAKMDMP